MWTKTNQAGAQIKGGNLVIKLSWGRIAGIKFNKQWLFRALEDQVQTTIDLSGD